jgi:type 1 glutamine amidotransferase
LPPRLVDLDPDPDTEPGIMSSAVIFIFSGDLMKGLFNFPYGLSLLLFLSLCMTKSLQAKPMEPFFKPGLIRVLILSGHNNHDWRATTPFLRQLLLETGKFDVRVEEEPIGITAETLAPFDVLINDYCGLRWGATTEKAVEDFVRSGKGFVIVHGSLYGFTGQEVLKDRHVGIGLKEPAWDEYVKMAGISWTAPPTKAYHAPYHFFSIKITQPNHSIVAGMPSPFPATDELYHQLTLRPGAQVLATAFDEPANGGTGKDEPMLVTNQYGEGRSFSIIFGHELASMREAGFMHSFVRGAEWAATGKVTIPADFKFFQPKADALKVLVVTGGHDFEPSFYSLFEGSREFTWKHATSNQAAFSQDLRKEVDVLVLYDFSQELDAAGKQNLQSFVESGKGLVVMHHALADYQQWPWWYREVVGGRYLMNPDMNLPASTYQHDVELQVKPSMQHPILQGIDPLHIWDETYKGLWISPEVKVLLKTENPMSDGPVAWISPYAKSKVVCIQLGHDSKVYYHPSYQRLVHNAILWTGGKQ